MASFPDIGSGGDKAFTKFSEFASSVYQFIEASLSIDQGVLQPFGLKQRPSLLLFLDNFDAVKDLDGGLFIRLLNLSKVRDILLS